MDFIYKFYILEALVVVILTFAKIAKMLIFKIPPSPIWIAVYAVLWVQLVKYNPFWKDVWKKE